MYIKLLELSPYMSYYNRDARIESQKKLIEHQHFQLKMQFFNID